jgi:hypothetical protein
VACGKKAQHWAYQYVDANREKQSEYGPYSTDLSDYAPMCSACHVAFDLAKSGREYRPTECGVDDCDGIVRARRMCSKHYQRFMRSLEGEEP